MSKRLHATSSNALFFHALLYVGNVNYRSLITVTFPIGSKNDNTMLEYEVNVKLLFHVYSSIAQLLISYSHSFDIILLEYIFRSVSFCHSHCYFK